VPMSPLIAALAALIGCQEGSGAAEAPAPGVPPPEVADPLGGGSSCAAYAAMPKVLAYCRYQTVRHLRTVNDMERVCAAAEE